MRTSPAWTLTCTDIVLDGHRLGCRLLHHACSTARSSSISLPRTDIESEYLTMSIMMRTNSGHRQCGSQWLTNQAHHFIVYSMALSNPESRFSG